MHIYSICCSICWCTKLYIEFVAILEDAEGNEIGRLTASITVTKPAVDEDEDQEDDNYVDEDEDDSEDEDDDSEDEDNNNNNDDENKNEDDEDNNVSENVVEINGECYDLTVGTPGDTNYAVEYYIEGVEISAEDCILFYINGELIDEITKEDGCNNFTVNNGEVVITNANPSANMYLKFKEDGTYTLYISDVTPEVQGIKLTLDPGIWNTDGAWYAVYYFDDAQGINGWIKISEDGTVVIPDGIVNIIFVRLNPASSEMNWNNKWNQTGNLTIGDKTTFVITSWTGGYGEDSVGEWR